MSEKMYALLLWLFPPRFRKSYGEDALQLFRDRARDETGPGARLRLWLDLFADLAVSVPREYFYAQPELVSASTFHRINGAPSFYVLANESPRPGALLFGGMLSFCALLTFSALLSQGETRRSSVLGAHPYQTAARSAGSSASETSAPQPARRAGPSDDRAMAPEQATPQTTRASNEMFADDSRSTQQLSDVYGSRADRSESAAALWQGPSPTNPASAAASTSAATALSPQLAAAERHRVVQGAIAALRQHYTDAGVAQKMAAALSMHEDNGDDNTAPDGPYFARLLTGQMRDVSHDMHLDVAYSASPLPDRPRGPSQEELASYREAMRQQNCTFEKAEILPRNIGYLKLNSFPDPAVCESAAKAAMDSLNHASALIFDLRDNRGGEPEMVALLAAYLFDHPEYWYNPRENTTQRSWTKSPVPGNKLADKPAYLLTSAATYSGAEQFCYDLKMLKRATLVGETTGGGAHAGAFHRIDDHFGIGIPEAKPVNPYGTNDWAEIGVTPDVKVSAAKALEVAVKLATAKLGKK